MLLMGPTLLTGNNFFFDLMSLYQMFLKASWLDIRSSSLPSLAILPFFITQKAGQTECRDSLGMILRHMRRSKIPTFGYKSTVSDPAPGGIVK